MLIRRCLSCVWTLSIGCYLNMALVMLILWPQKSNALTCFHNICIDNDSCKIATQSNRADFCSGANYCKKIIVTTPTSVTTSRLCSDFCSNSQVDLGDQVLSTFCCETDDYCNGNPLTPAFTSNQNKFTLFVVTLLSLFLPLIMEA